MHLIDNLQYANWSEKIFRQMQEGVNAVVTIAYHETFRETVANVEAWNKWFKDFELIFHGRTGDDVRRAKTEAHRNLWVSEPHY